MGNDLKRTKFSLHLLVGHWKITTFLETSSIHFYLKGKLGKIGQLITLEEPTDGVLVHREGDAVCQIGHALLEPLIWSSLLHSLPENDAERLGAGGWTLIIYTAPFVHS